MTPHALGSSLAPCAPLPPCHRRYSLPLLAPRLRGALHLVRLVGLDDVPLLDETPAPPPLHHLGAHRQEGAGAALPARALALLQREEVVEAAGGARRDEDKESTSLGDEMTSTPPPIAAPPPCPCVRLSCCRFPTVFLSELIFHPMPLCHSL